jgi:hypothetical protein
MKFALLGTDADALLLAAVAGDAGHTMVWLGDVRPNDASSIPQITSGLIDKASEWELLLDRKTIDAVLVGRGTVPAEMRAAQLKRLASEAVPLLVVHPVLDSVLPYYEVDMTRRESGGLICHYNPLIIDELVAVLSQWVANGHPSVGLIYQITCERRIPDGRRETTLSHLARDAEFIAAIAGDIRRVTAIGPKAKDLSFASLQVQISAACQATIRWSVRISNQDESELVLTLLGHGGFLTLTLPESRPISGEHVYQIEIARERQLDRQNLQVADPATTTVQRFVQALDAPDRAAENSTWGAATRAMEVLDAIELSLEKGRTIDVYQQQLTERLAFRGIMAAFGCGLLIVVFLMVLLVTLVGGAEANVGQRLLPSWPLMLLAMMGFFLLLQAVPLLANKAKKTDSALQKQSG